MVLHMTTYKSDNSLMIWTPEGVWLQTYTELGELRLSFVGVVSLGSVHAFCRSRGLRLAVRGRVPFDVPQRPSGRVGKHVDRSVARVR